MNYPMYTMWRRILIGIIGGGAAAGFIVSVRGFSSYGSTGFIDGTIIPIVFMGVADVFIWFAWKFLLDHFPFCSVQRRWQLLIVAMVLIAFVGCTNIYFSIFTLGGEKTMQRDATLVLARAEQTLHALYRQRAAEQGIVGLLEDQANIYAAHVRGEMNGGIWSRGKRGVGPISETIRSLQRGFEDAAAALHQATAENERRYKKGATILAELRDLVGNAEVPITERSNRVQKRLSDFTAIAVDMERSDLPRIESLVRRLDSVALVSNNNDTQMAQAVESLRGAVEKSKETVLEKISDLQSNAQPIPPQQYLLLDRFQSITEHWSYIVPIIACTTCMDVAIPLVSIFVLTFIVSRASPKTKSKPEGMENRHERTRPEHRELTDIDVAQQLRTLRRAAAGAAQQSRADRGIGGEPVSR
ncbi:MAG: hypothetical protein PHU25_01250 [Deltaproteobacteria bacterium]|nr:hypothetical protein [Deltaproteobacteria bacterium]